MLTRPRASFSTTRASAPGLFRSRLANATSSTKRTRAFRSARLATTGLFTVMRIFPRPFTSAAERERMLTRASDSARLMPARTPGLDLSDRTSWVVLAIARLLLSRLSELHASRCCGNASRSREGSSPARRPPVPNIRRMPSDSPLQNESARLPASRPVEASARIGGKYAPHACRIVHREHPGDEAARRAAHGDVREPRRRDDLAVGARYHVGLPVTRVVAALVDRSARAGHDDGRRKRGGAVECHAELGRHARLAGGEGAEPERGLVE